MIDKINWKKCNNLVPAIIQSDLSFEILMLGYMNKEALQKTINTKIVTFFSRTKKRILVKGETSGNFLSLTSLKIDCDNDTILIRAVPKGPVCHTGAQNCFNDDEIPNLLFLNKLSSIIQNRNDLRKKNSYVSNLFDQGKSRIAQKVGEEAVELALAYVQEKKEEIKNESADLIFHMLILLESAKISIDDVCRILEKRLKT